MVINLRSTITQLSLIIVILCLICPDVARALPVFPGAKGFGSQTIAGRKGKVIRVRNLNASGAGSLTEAISASGPRVVVFEVSGTIQIDGRLSIKNPYITIAGQTAPSPGITLRGATLSIRTHDVLVQHLRIRVGDKGGIFYDYRDAVTVGAGAYNVVVDHCSLSWATDEVLSLWVDYGEERIHDVTISNCIISEGLSNSFHSKGEHSKGLAVGNFTENISLIGNLLAHNTGRNPVLGGTKVAVINNLVYNPGWFGVSIHPKYEIIEASILANHILSGPNSSKYAQNYSVSLRDSTSSPWPGSPPGMGSKIHLQENKCDAGVQRNPSDWSYVDNRPNLDTGLFIQLEEPLMPGALDPLPVSDVKKSVIDYVGARPGDRDQVDSRIIHEVINRTGDIIDSQEQVGGWPHLQVNRRPLTLPENPDGDDDADGYTNLEEWLHHLASNVEGTAMWLPSPPRLRVVHIQ